MFSGEGRTPDAADRAEADGDQEEGWGERQEERTDARGEAHTEGKETGKRGNKIK